MYRLIFYELDKIWRKRSFILSICVLMIINLFLLWYINTPELKGTTEENYIDELYEEQQKVAGYKEYLRSVQESKDNLSSISIFKSRDKTITQRRNIEKVQKIIPSFREKIYGGCRQSLLKFQWRVYGRICF